MESASGVPRSPLRRVVFWGLSLALSHASLGCGPAREAEGAAPRGPDAIVALLPASLRDPGRTAFDAPDPAAREAALREISREGRDEVVPFLLALLEVEDSGDVRRRLVRELARWPTPDVQAALREIVREDPDVELALHAHELLHEVGLGDLLALLDARVAAARAGGPQEADAEARARLARAHDHFLTLRFGALLPRFLREPPPIFSVTPEDRPVRVLAFGDFGNGSDTQRETALAMARFHAREPFDFGITLGDNFYPRGLADPEDPRWETDWKALYGPLGIPFYASLGNHDWSDPASAAAEVLHEDPAWRLPAARYTFTAGPAQFFVLDTTALSLEQMDWLEAELEASRATWKIVYGHHPIHSGGRHGDPEHMAGLIPVLSGRADLYLAGHDHDMQYLLPEQGVHLAVIGSGGAGVRRVTAGPRTAFCASRYGFGVLDASAETLALRFVDRAGETLYRVRIPREPSGATGATRPADLPRAGPVSVDHCLGPA